MTSPDTLPEGFTWTFWQSAAQETGVYSLNMILLRAGLGKLVAAENSLPKRLPVSAGDFSLFNRAMREYYGSGARGLLIRTGRGAGHLMAQHLSLSCRLVVNWCRFLPKTWRVRRVLNSLADQIRYPDGGIVFSQAGGEIRVTDFGSLASLGQTAPEPICFTTVGLIHGVLDIVTGEELEVEEVSCTAVGGEACQFRVRFLK
jgi:predicted hydrocarbon binding protein